MHGEWGRRGCRLYAGGVHHTAGRPLAAVHRWDYGGDEQRARTVYRRTLAESGAQRTERISQGIGGWNSGGCADIRRRSPAGGRYDGFSVSLSAKKRGRDAMKRSIVLKND